MCQFSFNLMKVLFSENEALQVNIIINFSNTK
jgi:hypothetical protein